MTNLHWIYETVNYALNIQDEKYRFSQTFLYDACHEEEEKYVSGWWIHLWTFTLLKNTVVDVERTVQTGKENFLQCLENRCVAAPIFFDFSFVTSQASAYKVATQRLTLSLFRYMWN